jgi:peptidoglycan hydrolase-like protein with peptidoglycan-binding domain
MKVIDILIESVVLSVPQGNRGPEVAKMQQALVALGYQLPRFGVDGIRGPETSAAIRKFQLDNNIKIDGIPGPETIKTLNSVISANPAVANKLKSAPPPKVKPRAPVQMPKLQTDSVTQGKIGAVLDFIARYESNGNYNIIVGGRVVPELTSMTLNEIYDFQRQMVRGGSASSAVGRYQYIRKSLQMVANQMGLDPETTVFNPQTQDAIATYDLRRRAKMDSWLSGTITDDMFLNLVAKIWAGIPTTAGQSFYAGVGNNKAGTTSQHALAALQNIKTA